MPFALPASVGGSLNLGRNADAVLRRPATAREAPAARQARTRLVFDRVRQGSHALPEPRTA